MIGIIADDLEKEGIEEFFQLFKTPWEYYQENRTYRIIIIAKDTIRYVPKEGVIFIFSSNATLLDDDLGVRVSLESNDRTLRVGDQILPIYVGLSRLEGVPASCCLIKQGPSIFGIKIQEGRRIIHRIGYDLFKEIRFLLTNGQPQENALIPALDIHIDLLKTWILEAGVPVVEIPPAPEGYNFVVCLTHDADFVNIRDHFFDHTMAGFLYRALFGSFINVLKTKIPISRVLRNWKAVLALPFVFIGRIKDIWFQFDRYVEIERGMKSTFFIIPFKKRRGEKVLSSKRAAKYDIMDIRSTIEGLVKEGHEIGVHGIDAWHSQEKGEQERQRICDVTGQNNVGIRMHWLLSDSRTFITLESAGYQYDSSLGYNDAIGFRNGTTQIFRPLGVSHLLELPLHIQDTALFYSGRMNVSEKQASKLCDVFVQKALRHGGVLTINWHQRSLAPERLWEVFYLQFLDKLKVCLPWFASATQAVDWYQKRREVSFEQTERLGEEPQMIVRTGKMKGGPGLLLRVSYPRKHLSKTLKDHCLSEHIEGYVDIPLERNSTANSVLILSDRFIPLN